MNITTVSHVNEYVDPTAYLNTTAQLAKYFGSNHITPPRFVEGYDAYLDRFCVIVENLCKNTFWLVYDVEFPEDNKFIVKYRFNPEDTDAVIAFLKRIEQETVHPQIGIIHEEYEEYARILTVEYYPF